MSNEQLETINADGINSSVTPDSLYLTPKLGFGLMRLPMKGAEVDIEQTKRMADLCMENGFNYFDTAHGYINGLSEKAVKPVLSERYPRDSFTLANKLSWWCVKNGDLEGFFNKQLEDTGAGYFDCYLLHSLTADAAKKYEDMGVWQFAAEKKRQGQIKHIGFSFHDRAEVLEDILRKHPEAEFVQLQINYSDWESPGVQARLCYETARRYGKGVIVMEPVKGGALADLPASAKRFFDAVAPGKSQASFAMRFAASLDGVITVLSGMSDEAQARDNISTMRDFTPLTGDETDAVAAAAEAIKNAPRIPCTACGYCAENCPEKIPIPSIIRGAYNSWLAFENRDYARGTYNFECLGKPKASACVSCRACDDVCPQKLPVCELVGKCAELFE